LSGQNNLLSWVDPGFSVFAALWPPVGSGGIGRWPDCPIRMQNLCRAQATFAASHPTPRLSQLWLAVLLQDLKLPARLRSNAAPVPLRPDDSPDPRPDIADAPAHSRSVLEQALIAAALSANDPAKTNSSARCTRRSASFSGRPSPGLRYPTAISP
jgi:hypothetical protein